MNPIFEAAYELQLFCTAQGWRFCFIGGVAVQRWGNPRYTQDADLTLLTGFGNEETFIDPLLARYRARLPDARDFALMSRVLLLETASGVPLDIALGAMPFEERSVARATPFVIDAQHTITTCSAEDLIVHKAFADRPQDWLDIEGVIARQGRRLNQPRIWEELTPLVELKEVPSILDRLREQLDRLTP